MYADFFEFAAMPFDALPDGEDIYLAATHREALSTLVYGVLASKPLVLLTGDVGLGKSTVLATALEQVRTKRKLRIVSMPHPMLRPEEIMRLLGRGLDMKRAEVLKLRHFALLHQALRLTSARGEGTVLVVDEAQGLSHPTLEFLRLLSNIAMKSNCHFQIILVGQQELWATLQLESFRHLRQRVAIRAELKALPRKDARAYLQYRLQRVGSRLEKVFSRGALRTLLRLGRGEPRRLNWIADNALMYAFGDGVRSVSSAHVRAAAGALDGTQESIFQRAFRPAWVLPAVLLAALVSAAVHMVNTHMPARQLPATPTHAEPPAIDSEKPRGVALLSNSRKDH
jgi:type II secretory pathway predicted ATPase ExeA